MKTYAIQWKSIVTGTIGTGTKRFEKEAAECLAKELNDSYPEIVHEAVIPAPPAAQPAAAEPALTVSDLPTPAEPENVLRLFPRK